MGFASTLRHHSRRSDRLLRRMPIEYFEIGPYVPEPETIGFLGDEPIAARVHDLNGHVFEFAGVLADGPVTRQVESLAPGEFLIGRRMIYRQRR
ncbi:hypothetical protein [Segnochrobactrum spirostomi]|uniref:Uncharacterized protein n=1 Tax=Segnochrobactrum spirostomi TaxID=2608987 RepID=A0A6A7Y3C6_9HYPH|nr:hypothetical protein [Segnochrobactrum spirostomi]MQT13583.1 hypothetical protein [Segnochrobactrum spirostomi]